MPDILRASEPEERIRIGKGEGARCPRVFGAIVDSCAMRHESFTLEVSSQREAAVRFLSLMTLPARSELVLPSM